MNVRYSWMAAVLALMLPIATWTYVAEAKDCPRGTLAELYCDEDGDLVADTPTDKSKWRNPSTLVFTYTPVEETAQRLDCKRYIPSAGLTISVPCSQ